jgi:hypothetical protein
MLLSSSSALVSQRTFSANVFRVTRILLPRKPDAMQVDCVSAVPDNVIFEFVTAGSWSLPMRRSSSRSAWRRSGSTAIATPAGDGEREATLLLPHAEGF